MRVTLNLGLDKPTHGPDTKLTRGQRLSVYRSKLIGIMQPPPFLHNRAPFDLNCYYEAVPFELALMADAGLLVGIKDDTLVVFGHMNSHVTDKHFHDLCVMAEQDCIALYLPDLKMGALIGPHAAEWGAFNPEYFVYQVPS